MIEEDADRRAQESAGYIRGDERFEDGGPYPGNAGQHPTTRF
jgi:hypothetical protein